MKLHWFYGFSLFSFYAPPPFSYFLDNHSPLNLPDHFLLLFSRITYLFCIVMSDLSFFSEDFSTPSHIDSVLNPHFNHINCNIDQHLGCNCKYYDTYLIIDEGALHQSELSIFHHSSRSLNKRANIIVVYICILNHNFDIIGFTET